MSKWHVANTHVNAEMKAATHLLRQGFNVYLPQYLRLRSHARRREWVPRPLFPRYIFVEFDPKNARWRTIQSTVGVSHLVCFGDKLANVPVEVIDALSAKEDERGMIVLKSETSLKKGAPIRLMSGALCGERGVFDSIDDQERVVILLNMLGREVRVQTSITMVQTLQ